MIMQPVTDELLEDIVARLVEALHPQAIYLFGSHASGKAHPHSDVDLLVVVDDDAGNRWDLATRGRAALLDLPFPVDILVYHRSQIDKWSSVRCSLPYTAVRKGRRLYAA